jgi:hypothetical protein
MRLVVLALSQLEVSSLSDGTPLLLIQQIFRGDLKVNL